MSTLILDIETVGEAWTELDLVTQESLLRWIHRVARTPEESLALEKDVREGLGFSPLTGMIIALGLYDVERERGVVYYLGEGDDECDDDTTYRPCSEKKMLSDFWSGAVHYDTFVTFNGRCFDVPFVFHRSAIHGVRPTKNLLEGRYPYQQKSCRHIDLQDELTFYGVMQKRPNLHLFCRAYGIESPKEMMSGDDVARLFRQGQVRDIATYNAADVRATTALYQVWRSRLAFPGSS